MDSRTLARFACIAVAGLLAGCAASTPFERAEPDCTAVMARIDASIDRAGVRDGGAARIEGFPQLRVDRFLASYAAGPSDTDSTREWVDRLAGLGRRGQATELANLPAGERRALEQSLSVGDDRALDARARRCAAELTERDLASPERLATLRQHARVPDDYDTWKRVVGLYWITRLAFANGIRHWHDEVHERFAQPIASLSDGHPLTAFSPPEGRANAAQVASILERAASSALRIPDPVGDDAETLYRTFAPTFVVARGSAADDPGEIHLADGAPRVEAAAVVYRRMSHARLGERALLQLEYWIWFPERPMASGFDLLGGRLDAVLWRVTLGPDGEPWVYDTIHDCGCYHLFFPTARAVARPVPDTLDETAFIPQRLPRVGVGTPIEVWIQAGTHYVQRVVPGNSGIDAVRYAFREDEALRSLPRGDGTTASLFAPDGLVPGTERGERWLFWPMGIREPGAMRQWGRHPTAFVGRRHFDDPLLIPGSFELH